MPDGKYIMKNLLTGIVLFAFTISSYSQNFNNGNFNANGAFWGCNPEINTETTYGGFIGSNLVAEIDQSAGLCQTVTGFVIGASYSLNFRCSRRTNCGPVLQSMNVTGSGGILGVSVSRNNTPFNLVPETFFFVATSPSHTFTFTGTSATTCGLLVDDIIIAPVSTLPVELLSFDAKPIEEAVQLIWETASENNNDFFTLEKSVNGSDWSAIGTVNGAGNSQEMLSYEFTDRNPLNGISYYRLKQTDFDGNFEYSDIRSVNFYGKSSEVYINAEKLWLIMKKSDDGPVYMSSVSGNRVEFLNKIISETKEELILDISGLSSGIYFLLNSETSHKIFVP